jgi:glycosyltransferase involved in cell wall biosynthesis
VQNPDDFSAFADEQLLPAEKIRLIRGLGVNIERFNPRLPGAEDPESTPPGPSRYPPLKVLVATRLLWEKGLREYVQAARLLKNSGHDVEFLLAGDPDPGNPASIQTEQLMAWRNEGIINFLGYVDDMPGLFSRVDVAVLPSYREGLPQCMLEAAACGLPLVATDVPGCREIVEDGVNGLLIPPRNSAALAEAIAHLDRNRAQCRVLGDASRRKVLQDFDEKTILRMTLNVYREILHS